MENSERTRQTSASADSQALVIEQLRHTSLKMLPISMEMTVESTIPIMSIKIWSQIFF